MNKAGKAVPGEGNANANIVFIGEAPGRKEAETGRPFIGRSGKFLRLSIKNIGLEEEDVFITSPVKYMPKYKTPKSEDIAHGRVHLRKQLEAINPKIIVLLGSVACKAALGYPVLIKKEHGRTKKMNGKTYFIMYHPAAIIRFPKFKKSFFDDFEKLKKLIEKCALKQ